MKRKLILITALTAAMWGAAYGLSLLIQKAKAHEARTGRQYDAECCSDRDCREAAEGEVTLTAGGWLIRPTGEVIPMGDPRIRQSKDEHFHMCIIPPGTGRTLCLYVPPFGT